MYFKCWPGPKSPPIKALQPLTGTSSKRLSASPHSARHWIAMSIFYLPAWDVVNEGLNYISLIMRQVETTFISAFIFENFLFTSAHLGSVSEWFLQCKWRKLVFCLSYALQIPLQFVLKVFFTCTKAFNFCAVKFVSIFHCGSRVKMLFKYFIASFSFQLTRVYCALIALPTDSNVMSCCWQACLKYLLTR